MKTQRNALETRRRLIVAVVEIESKRILMRTSFIHHALVLFFFRSGVVDGWLVGLLCCA